jgi:hypothetical protein
MTRPIQIIGAPELNGSLPLFGEEQELIEEWRSVPTDCRYEVSSFGRVRRIRAVGGYRYLKYRKAGAGYLQVSLGRRNNNYVHRLVLFAFVGPPPVGKPEAAHWNGVITDNRLKNLRWSNHIENESDKIRHGTGPIGERNGMAKLTEKQVREIKLVIRCGDNRRQIAARFEVSRHLIDLIANGKRWAHVSL